MNRAGVPVDLLNPGQVFASLGFLEAAHVLCGGAEGGFDVSGETDARLVIVANGCRDPFDVVLEFLAEAELVCIAPLSYRKKQGVADGIQLECAEHFPARVPEPMALPVRLEHDGQRLSLAHWCDGSSRNSFKLYAGNRSAARIARAMLRGDENRHTEGVQGLWQEDPERLRADPFNVPTAMGGSFNFDARATWTRLEAGYSPNDHKDHRVASSPVVEILAAIGLEHARPQMQRDEVRYGAWSGPVPPSLARAALGCSAVPVPLRIFRFTFAHKGDNKAVTFAHNAII